MEEGVLKEGGVCGGGWGVWRRVGCVEEGGVLKVEECYHMFEQMQNVIIMQQLKRQLL